MLPRISIQALSNQKFRELTDEFADVGLMTGDVTINPEASLLGIARSGLQGSVVLGGLGSLFISWGFSLISSTHVSLADEVAVVRGSDDDRDSPKHALQRQRAHA